MLFYTNLILLVPFVMVRNPQNQHRLNLKIIKNTFVLGRVLNVFTSNALEQMNCSTKNGSMTVDPRSRVDHSADTVLDKSNA